MMKGLGSFCLIRNEKLFIEAHLRSWLPHLEQMVFFDGSSTDGTLEILKQAQYGEYGKKIRLFTDKDPKDLTTDYQRLSNEALHSLDTDFAVFLHPDMFLDESSKVNELPKDCIAASFNIRSFAGDPDGMIYEIKGRGEKWKDIYRLHNPDIGAHYHGFYGAQNEDIYFSEITGNEHSHYGTDFAKYPYAVHDSGITILHYSDVRPWSRRYDRMLKCLINQGHSKEDAEKIASVHPRVTLKSGQGFDFKPVETPVFLGGIYQC